MAFFQAIKRKIIYKIWRIFYNIILQLIYLINLNLIYLGIGF